MMKSFITTILLLVTPVEGCFFNTGGSGSSSSSGGNSQTTAQPVASQTTQPKTTTSSTTSSPSAPNCGHSRYWASGDGSSANSASTVGTNSKINEFPYQARLLWSSSGAACSGSIISESFVMTAGHCCDMGIDDLVSVIVGDHNKTTVDVGEVSIAASEFIIHPSYAYDTLDYDFCLVRTEEPMVWTDQVQPICLPQSCSQECKAVNAAGTSDNVIITGWGAMSERDTSKPQLLQKATIPVVSTASCSKSYSQIDQVITDNMVCGGSLTGNLCQADSGGPMTCYKNGYYQLDGVTSFGNGCGQRQYYGVYARVCKVLDWISSTMASNAPEDGETTAINAVTNGDGSDDVVRGFRVGTTTKAAATRRRMTAKPTTTITTAVSTTRRRKTVAPTTTITTLSTTLQAATSRRRKTVPTTVATTKTQL